MNQKIVFICIIIANIIDVWITTIVIKHCGYEERNHLMKMVMTNYGLEGFYWVKMTYIAGLSWFIHLDLPESIVIFAKIALVLYIIVTM